MATKSNFSGKCAVKAQVSVLGYRLLDCEMNFQALILLVMMPSSGVGRTVGCEVVGPSDWMGLGWKPGSMFPLPL